MRRIILDPRLGAAEAFMDGDMRIERGDIMALIQLLRMNAPWDRGSTLEDRGPVGETIDWIRTRIDSFHRRRRSRANVAHHYDIGSHLYRLFLDSDLQYSRPYCPRAETTLKSAPARETAHNPPNPAPRPGPRG